MCAVCGGISRGALWRREVVCADGVLCWWIFRAVCEEDDIFHDIFREQVDEVLK